MKMVHNENLYCLDLHEVPKKENREPFRNGYNALDARNGGG